MTAQPIQHQTERCSSRSAPASPNSAAIEQTRADRRELQQ